MKIKLAGNKALIQGAFFVFVGITVIMLVGAINLARGNR